jgi:hypothetical protein
LAACFARLGYTVPNHVVMIDGVRLVRQTRHAATRTILEHAFDLGRPTNAKTKPFPPDWQHDRPMTEAAIEWFSL